MRFRLSVLWAVVGAVAILWACAARGAVFPEKTGSNPPGCPCGCICDTLKMAAYATVPTDCTTPTPSAGRFKVRYRWQPLGPVAPFDTTFFAGFNEKVAVVHYVGVYSYGYRSMWTERVRPYSLLASTYFCQSLLWKQVTVCH